MFDCCATVGGMVRTVTFSKSASYTGVDAVSSRATFRRSVRTPGSSGAFVFSAGLGLYKPVQWQEAATIPGQWGGVQARGKRTRCACHRRSLREACRAWMDKICINRTNLDKEPRHMGYKAAVSCEAELWSHTQEVEGRSDGTDGVVCCIPDRYTVIHVPTSASNPSTPSYVAASPVKLPSRYRLPAVHLPSLGGHCRPLRNIYK